MANAMQIHACIHASMGMLVVGWWIVVRFRYRYRMKELHTGSKIAVHKSTQNENYKIQAKSHHTFERSVVKKLTGLRWRTGVVVVGPTGRFRSHACGLTNKGPTR